MRTMLWTTGLGLLLVGAPAWADVADDTYQPQDDGGDDDGGDDDEDDEDDDGCGDDDATTGASIGLGVLMLLGLRRRWE